MSERYFPFNSVNGDRKYDASYFAGYFSKLFTTGIFANFDNGLLVQASPSHSMNVIIATGAATVEGYQYWNDEVINLAVPVAGTQARIDSVVLRLNLESRTLGVVYKQNDTSVVRSADGSIYELQLAKVNVGKNVSAITAADVTDMRADGTVAGYSSLFGKVPLEGITAQYKQLFADYYDDSQNLFNNFFESIKDTLSTDAAGNLKLQIDKLGDTDIALSGDVSGMKSLNEGGSIVTSLVNVTRTNTTSSLQLGPFDNHVAYIDGITTDTKGRVTAVNTKTFVTAANSAVSSWEANHAYQKNAIVYIGELGTDTTGHIKGGLFRANAAHTSGSTFPANGANWTLLNADAYTRYYPSIAVGFARTIPMYRQGRTVTAAGYFDAAPFPVNTNTATWNALSETIPANLRPVITVILPGVGNWSAAYIGFKVGPDGSLKYKKEGAPYGDVTGSWIVKPELGYEFAAGVPTTV
ncbi:MAG: hypothetical protein LBT37_04165 [Lactobacillaceae bacterium]|jgi:hypothetical protein|nr:hypothetical protein [Lactobacillaceae bacterium]